MLGKHRNRETHGQLSDQPDASRRQFLRRAGITAAVAAAFAGTADMAGIPAAAAAAKGMKRRPDFCCISYTYAPFHCNGGSACPSGQCCFHWVSCHGSGYACIAHSCSNFTAC